MDMAEVLVDVFESKFYSNTRSRHPLVKLLLLFSKKSPSVCDLKVLTQHIRRISGYVELLTPKVQTAAELPVKIRATLYIHILSSSL